MPPSKRDTSSAAIHGPAAKGDAVKVDMAVRAGVDVNATDLGSFSPLHWAAMKGHLTVAAVLVANRAKLSKKDRKGKTPLDFARDGGYVAHCSERLRGCTPWCSPFSGRSPSSLLPSLLLHV